jgi:hypothetical protein
MDPIGSTVLAVGSVPSSFSGPDRSAGQSSAQEVSASRRAPAADAVTLSRIAALLGQIQQRLEATSPEDLARFLSGSADSLHAAALQVGDSAEGKFLENLAIRLQVAANFPGISALPSFSLNSLFAD